MKNKTKQELYAFLAQQQVVVQLDNLSEENSLKGFKNIFLIVLSFLLGLGAISMFFGFLYLLDRSLIDNSTVLSIIGVVCLFGAYKFNKIADVSFQQGLALVLYCAGFIFTVAAVTNFFAAVELQGYVYCYLVIALASLFIYLFDNLIVTFLNYLSILVGLYMLLYCYELDFLALGFLIVMLIKGVLMLKYEAYFLSYSPWAYRRFMPALGGVVVFTLCASMVMSFSGNEFVVFKNTGMSMSIYALLLTAIGVYSVRFVLYKLQVVHWLSYCVLGVFGLILFLFSYYYPSFAVGFTFLLWCFMRSQRVLMILSAGAFLWAGFFFYYDLQMNLMDKSLLLIGSSCVFFVLYYLLLKHKKNE